MRSICAASFALAFVIASVAVARTATSPYARVPATGQVVRFDGSAGGEHEAWAYGNLNYLEAFLRSTIDAALAGTSYEEYQKRMNLVLAHSIAINNGMHATVQHVQPFTYRDHSDVEVQVRLDYGEHASMVVWTTPAELVDSSGRPYLR